MNGRTTPKGTHPVGWRPRQSEAERLAALDKSIAGLRAIRDQALAQERFFRRCAAICDEFRAGSFERVVTNKVADGVHAGMSLEGAIVLMEAAGIKMDGVR